LVREAQPAARRPANAVNAINFFIIKPFMIYSKLLAAWNYLNQAFHPIRLQGIPPALGRRGAFPVFQAQEPRIRLTVVVPEPLRISHSTALSP
jgi:hypothetical protein